MKSSIEIFSYNLTNMLNRKHKTQRELAKALDVTEATVSRWVNGEAMPRHAMLDRISALLVVSPDELTTDHTKTVELLPEDVIATELREHPKLFQLFIVAMRATDDEIDACIRLLKK